MNEQTKTLEILVIEDNEKHTNDAKEVSKEYKNVNFSYAKNVEEAKQLIAENQYDAAISDVFIPEKENQSPSWENGIRLGIILDENDIPFLFNTSGNHHGVKYDDFLKNKYEFWNEIRFANGTLIESYPENGNADADTKQWEGAINYSIIQATTKSPGEDLSEGFECAFETNSYYGDYGRTTDQFRKLLDENVTIKDFDNEGYPGSEFFPVAREYIQKTISKYKE